jgi:hypothetical protein
MITRLEPSIIKDLKILSKMNSLKKKPDIITKLILYIVRIDNYIYKRNLERKGFYNTGYR